MKKSKTTPKQHWLYTASISTCALTFGVAVVMGTYTYIKDLNKPQNPTSAVSDQTEQRLEKEFTAVVYRGIPITNCRDAYYTLKEWAQNDKRMKLRPQEEKLEIQPVYDSLKEYQGIYYEKLAKENWTTAFEAK